MRVEGVDLAQLAERVGTPFYCYSARTIAEAYAGWRTAFAEAGFPSQRHRICFAVKANSALAVLRHLANAGAEFDVVSAGELHRVLAAGGFAQDAVFSGPGKREEDLRYAFESGVGLINIEVPEELDVLRGLAQDARRPVRIGVRLNPDLDPQTHPAIATGPRQTKFGLAPEEIDLLLERRAFDRDFIVKAVAVHIGSQVSELEPMAEAARQALRWATRLRDAGQPVAWIDIGGGLAIAYDDDRPVPTPAQFAACIADALRDWDGGLITEPGRVLVGSAGWLVTRVTAVRQRDERRLAVCDAGMNALLRPALYGARHRVSALEESGEEHCWDVMGPLCEAGDVLAREVTLRGVAPQALLTVHDVGAYGFVMASEYNSHPRPAQIWIDGDRWSTITPRATYEEMLEGEQVAPWQPPVSADGAA